MSNIAFIFMGFNAFKIDFLKKRLNINLSLIHMLHYVFNYLVIMVQFTKRLLCIIKSFQINKIFKNVDNKLKQTKV